MPLFTWKPLAGKNSYYVLVAKDPSFSNIVDYAFTQQPAYAPRTASQPTTYADEETLYYWAVLPANSANGDGAVGNPLQAAPENFQKLSNPPSQLAPSAGADVNGQPTFQWTSAEGARRYRLQVSNDPSFGTVLDDVQTASTAYTSATSYPADTVLYWRVRADDENLVGLRWSSVGTSSAASGSLAEVRAADGRHVPADRLEPRAGAVSYQVAIDEPDGDHAEYNDFRLGRRQLREDDRHRDPRSPCTRQLPDEDRTDHVRPWSATSQFTRTMSRTGARTDASPNHLLFAWDPKPARSTIASWSRIARTSQRRSKTW